MTMLLPRESIGCNKSLSTSPGRQKNENVWQNAMGVSWWMESLGKSRGQTPWDLWPLDFWPGDFPKDSIHPDTPSAFAPIVPGFMHTAFPKQLHQ